MQTVKANNTMTTNETSVHLIHSGIVIPSQVSNGRAALGSEFLNGTAPLHLNSTPTKHTFEEKRMGKASSLGPLFCLFRASVKSFRDENNPLTRARSYEGATHSTLGHNHAVAGISGRVQELWCLWRLSRLLHNFRDARPPGLRKRQTMPQRQQSLLKLIPYFSAALGNVQHEGVKILRGGKRTRNVGLVKTAQERRKTKL
jgi:hypothetical protein